MTLEDLQKKAEARSTALKSVPKYIKPPEKKRIQKKPSQPKITVSVTEHNGKPMVEIATRRVVFSPNHRLLFTVKDAKRIAELLPKYLGVVD